MNSWILEVQWYLLRDHTLDNNYCLEVYTNSMKHKYQRNNHIRPKHQLMKQRVAHYISLSLK